MSVDIFSGNQLTLTKFENGAELRLSLEKKGQEPAKILQKIQKKGEEESDVFVVI